MKILFLLLNFAFAFTVHEFESPQIDEQACIEWKSAVSKWLLANAVRMVDKDKEVAISCTKAASGWTGQVFYTFTPERAQRFAKLRSDLDCGASIGEAVTRSIASASEAIVTPCKIAANDIATLQKWITSPPTKAGLGNVCCDGVKHYQSTCNGVKSILAPFKCARCVPC